MMTISNKRLTLVGLVLALGLGYVAGAAGAKPDAPDHDGVLVLTTIQKPLDLNLRVEVGENGVYAVSGDKSAPLRLLIKGGKGLVNNGTLSADQSVHVYGVGGDKKHTHRGHVTVLK